MRKEFGAGLICILYSCSALKFFPNSQHGPDYKKAGAFRLRQRTAALGSDDHGDRFDFLRKQTFVRRDEECDFHVRQ